MTRKKTDHRKQERMARLMIRIAARSSRNQTLLDRLCRMVLNRATALPPEEDFLRDPLIDNDEGFDPDELDRYQRGETA
ncbi:hypothetical protein [Pyruvatibacter mobilis]|uniref:hypothetical protein n=1 Tax=Pyruvatibacter mobilis TaxID=1712261 RepID=UPI003D0B42A0